MNESILKETVAKIKESGKGILAADESAKTATKRLEAVGVASTDDSRRDYREMLFTAPNLSKYLSGVILYEETLYQKSRKGVPLPEVLARQGIIPGIKVDQGLTPFEGSEIEETTKGLDGLAERFDEYKKFGAKFAKWRCVYHITDSLPSDRLISANAHCLAHYAHICQEKGIVPIVEPEVLIDGTHTIERCEEVSRKVLKAVFDSLKDHNIFLQGIILKPSMVISGKGAKKRADVKEVAKRTVDVLKSTVPKEVQTINFLSGGQTPIEATAHLQAMHELGNLPWNLSFSYARALQEPPLDIWRGKDANVAAAQKAFIKRLHLNSLASQGKYQAPMENE